MSFSTLLRVLQLPVTISVRGSRRKGYRLKHMELQRKAKLRKLADESETAPVQRSWIETMMIKQAKQKAGKIVIYPPYYTEKENLLTTITDDVWVEEDYAMNLRLMSIAKAIEMHREANHPTILNNLSGKVRLRLDLRMNLEKKSKFVHNTNPLISLPHQFPHGKHRKVICFAKEKNSIDEAIQAGADYAGGPDLIKEIMKGDVTLDDVDFVVSHTDMTNDIVVLRGVLKKRYPTAQEGFLGTDLKTMLHRVKHGIACDIRADLRDPAKGYANAIVGTLDMPVEQLEANIVTMIKAVCQLRPLHLGEFITRAMLMVDPSVEYFAFPFVDYTPKPADADISDKEAKKRAKKAAKQQPAVAASA